MKKEIKLLQKCQQFMLNNIYPGYSFQLSAIIDIESDKVYDDDESLYSSKTYTIEEFLKNITVKLAYRGLGCSKMTKGSWIVEQDLGSHEDILKANDEEFYLDNMNAIKLYFALNSAIRTCQKNNKKSIIFAAIDDELDFVDLKVFNNYEEIEGYYNKYFKEEE